LTATAVVTAAIDEGAIGTVVAGKLRISTVASANVSTKVGTVRRSTALEVAAGDLGARWAIAA